MDMNIESTKWYEKFESIDRKFPKYYAEMTMHRNEKKHFSSWHNARDHKREKFNKFIRKAGLKNKELNRALYVEESVSLI